ncbi:MAG: GGDEF domain-containing protein [Rhodospirillales bacterium]
MEVNQAAPVQPVGPGGGHGGGAGPGGGKKDQKQEQEAKHGHEGPAINVSGLLGMEGLTPEAQHILERVASEIEPLRHQLTHALEELEEARENEYRDAVVPTLNRRGFLAKLDQLIHRLGQTEARPALILVHLVNGDGLRRSQGLAALDEARRLTCDVLTSDSHQAMIVGCVGGNDFAVVVLEDGIDGARRKAGELEAASRATHTAQGIFLETRTGVTLLEPGMTPDAALAAADRDLL